MNVIGELQSIMQSGGISRARLSSILRELADLQEKRTRTPYKRAMPVTQYTEIERNTTCLHCGSVHKSTLKFKEREDTVGINEGGKVMIINSQSPVKVDCVSRFCNLCSDFVSKMSREELEERYMLLLTGFREVKSYGNLFTKAQRQNEEEDNAADQNVGQIR